MLRSSRQTIPGILYKRKQLLGKSLIFFNENSHTSAMNSSLMLIFVLLLFISLTSSQPLCQPPVTGEDDQFITCEIEQGSFNTTTSPDDFPSVVRVVEYNIDRNGNGGDGSREGGIEPILKLLADVNVIPTWDVLILSEVAR